MKPLALMKETLYFLHESSYADVGAQIGSGTKIWHFCHVMGGAVIGENCILGQNVFVGGGVIIGNGVKIQNNVSLYTGVLIEDEVFLGPSVVLTNVLQPRAFIERKDEFLPTVIERGATVGANATIICGARIGRYAMVGAGAVVRKDVKPYALVVGNPAQVIGWVSKSGRRLVFNDEGIAFCTESDEKYLRLKDEIQILT